jgi:flagellar protein FliO/FliZ
MTIKIRIRRPHFFGKRQQIVAPVFTAAAPAESPFQATLRECIESSTDDMSALEFTPAMPAPVKQPTLDVAKALGHVFSWMRKKYKLTATKRLRLAETLNLGEKRFVALVSVEGREFLIGGGATGVSLLAQLGDSNESATIIRRRTSREIVNAL